MTDQETASYERYQGKGKPSNKKPPKTMGRLTITVRGEDQQTLLNQPLSLNLEEGELMDTAPLRQCEYTPEEGQTSDPPQSRRQSGAARRRTKHYNQLKRQRATREQKKDSFKQWATANSAPQHQGRQKQQRFQHRSKERQRAFKKTGTQGNKKQSTWGQQQQRRQPSAYALGRAKMFGLEDNPAVVAAMDKPAEREAYKKTSALRLAAKPEGEKHPQEDAAMLNWLTKSLRLAGVHDLDEDPALTAQTANALSRAPQKLKDKLASVYSQFQA